MRKMIIKQKSMFEIGREIWEIKRKKDGRVVQKFRTKLTAQRFLEKMNEGTIGIYFLERNNKWRFGKPKLK